MISAPHSRALLPAFSLILPQGMRERILGNLVEIESSLNPCNPAISPECRKNKGESYVGFVVFFLPLYAGVEEKYARFSGALKPPQAIEENIP